MPGQGLAFFKDKRNRYAHLPLSSPDRPLMRLRRSPSRRCVARFAVGRIAIGCCNLVDPQQNVILLSDLDVYGLAAIGSFFCERALPPRAPPPRGFPPLGSPPSLSLGTGLSLVLTPETVRRTTLNTGV